MKNKLFFRVIGALFSSLIIISVFMPFTKLDTQSLWDMYRSYDMIYLPIMIIVFGSIGVLFFSLNVKTEFAYATSGAIIFFTVMQLVQAINYGTLNDLGLGFYFLAVGGVVTGLMAFLSNLKGKSVKVESLNQMPEMNVINVPVQNVTPQQIDTLNNNLGQVPDMQINMDSNVPVNMQNAVEQPIESIKPVELLEPVQPVNPVSTIPEITSQSNMELQNNNVQINPIGVQSNDVNMNSQVSLIQQPTLSNNINNNPMPQVEVPIQNNISNQTPIPEIDNTNNSFNAPNVTMNSVQPEVVMSQHQNPVLRQFTQQQNPVVDQFVGPQQNSTVGQVTQSVMQNNTIPNSTVESPQTTNSNSNMQGLDIFGNFQ